MKKIDRNQLRNMSIEVMACEGDFEQVRAFVEEKLEMLNVKPAEIQESILLFEELFVCAVNEIGNTATSVVITIDKTLAETALSIDYDGKRFDRDIILFTNDNFSTRILGRYDERLSFRYRRGHNRLSLQVTRSVDSMLLWCSLAVVLGIVIYAIALLTMGHSHDTVINLNAYTFEKLFFNAILMISAPVTFFSMVTNLTSALILSDRRLKLKSMYAGIVMTSVLAMSFAYLYYLLMKPILDSFSFTGMEYYASEGLFVQSITELIPSNVFEAFTVLSPYPLIAIAVLTSLAFSRVDKHFDFLKLVNDSFNELFEKILNVIMMFLPLATLFAVLDILSADGFRALAMNALVILLVHVGLIVLLIAGCVRLSVGGINPGSFIRVCKPALRENYIINSGIDAITYNIRFCNRHFGMSYKFLDVRLPILSRLNLDGNCFIVFSLSLLTAENVGIEIPMRTLIGMAVLTFALSVGAPNQSGSLIIGFVVLFSFIGISSTIACLPILFEAFVGRALPLSNCFSNLVTVALDGKRNGEFKMREPKTRSRD